MAVHIPEEHNRTQQQKFTFTDAHRVTIETSEREIPGVIFGISKTGIWITDIEIQKPTLEDVFLQIARGDA